METRFVGMGRGRALVVAALFLLALLGAAWSVGHGSSPRMRSDVSGQSDADLYRAVIAGVEQGGDYYAVATRELRAGHYPLHPFISYRLPTLAWMSAALGARALHVLQLALGAAVMVAWWRRWRGVLAPVELVAALVLLAGGLVGLLQPTTGLFHESWAAMLLALAIGLDGRRWAVLAILAGAAALLLRELSLPLVIAFAGLALIERRWRVALGWAAALALFAFALFFHAHAVAAVALPTDLSSPGWSGRLGPGFALRSLAQTNAAIALPPVAVALVVTASLFALASLRADWALRAALMVAGYLALIALFARPDNFYWGIMAAPLSLVGLAFLPRALRDLAAAVRPVAVVGR